MDFYDKLEEFKEENGLSYRELGEIINVSADTFRMGMKRRSFNKPKVRMLERAMAMKANEIEEDLPQDLYFYKEGVKFHVSEMITFLIGNMKEIKDDKRLQDLSEAITTVKNINSYNHLNNEIEKIKQLLERNKNVLK